MVTLRPRAAAAGPQSEAGFSYFSSAEIGYSRSN